MWADLLMVHTYLLAKVPFLVLHMNDGNCAFLLDFVHSLTGYVCQCCV